MLAFAKRLSQAFSRGSPPRTPQVLCVAMSRLPAALFALFCTCSVTAAQPALNTARLTDFDRLTLEAALQGDVARLEPHLAPRFQATIQVPAEHGRYQTLVFTRAEFLLYAWQARAAAEHYRARARPGRYRIAADGASAIGTRVVDESLTWNGQPLSYSTERTTHYRPYAGGILITRLTVRILDGRQAATAAQERSHAQ